MVRPQVFQCLDSCIVSRHHWYLTLSHKKRQESPFQIPATAIKLNTLPLLRPMDDLAPHITPLGILSVEYPFIGNKGGVLVQDRTIKSAHIG